MLLALLFFGYATGVFSSRKLEQATYDSVAFRFITGDRHPDHDTIAHFRKRFLVELEGLFLQILVVAKAMGVFKSGTVSLDGTRIKANASKHKAMSWQYANKLEEQLHNEVQELLRQAEKADVDDRPEMDIPEELARREDRLAAIKKAREAIEKRAQERFESEQSEYEEKLRKRAEKEAQTGKKARGRAPKAPQPGPGDKDQVNFTDEASRIMPSSEGDERFETPAPCPPNADAVTTMAHRLSRDCARDRLRGQGHLCQTKIYRGDGVWHCERGVGIPAMPSSRATSGARRMESGLHGLESAADVRFEGLRACSRQVYHRKGFCFSGPRACRGALQWVGQSKNRFD